jgi:hypothetical protein
LIKGKAYRIRTGSGVSIYSLSLEGVDVKVLQKLEILNRGNKMLKKFLRQVENNDKAPIKEGNRD